MLGYPLPSTGPLFQFLASSVAKPRPMALTKTLFQAIWSHPHSDMEAQNVLDYLPRCRGLPFQFLASKAFLESPDQWVSPKLYFRSFAHTTPEIWRLEMCSTIRHLLGAHCFSFL